MTHNIVNVVEAAEILGVARRTVQDRIAAGTLQAEKLPGKTGSYILDRSYVESLRDDATEAAS